MLRPARHRLPPLNTLRFFEAAARHGSFARAAAELCIRVPSAGRSRCSKRASVLRCSIGIRSDLRLREQAKCCCERCKMPSIQSNRKRAE